MDRDAKRQKEMGCAKRKSAFEHAQKCAESHHSAHARGLIRVFALERCILQYPMILAADSKGTDQTVHPRSLIWAFAIHAYSKAHLRLSRLNYRLM